MSQTSTTGETDELKWYDQEKTEDVLRDIAKKTDEGSMIIQAEFTSYIEFKLDEPEGTSKKCTCNKCWNEFFISPFSSAVECPFCHTRGVNIHEGKHIKEK